MGLYQWVCHKVGGRAPHHGGGGGGGGSAAPTELIEGRWVPIGQDGHARGVPRVKKAKVGAHHGAGGGEGHLVCHQVGPLDVLPPGYGALPVEPGVFVPGPFGPGVLGGYDTFVGSGGFLPGYFGPPGVGGFVPVTYAPHQPGEVVPPLLPPPGPVVDVPGGPTVPGGTVTPPSGPGGPVPVPAPGMEEVFVVLMLALVAAVEWRRAA